MYIVSVLINLSSSVPLDDNVPERVRLRKIFFYSHFECLIAELMFTSPKIRDRSLTIKSRSTFP